MAPGATLNAGRNVVVFKVAKEAGMIGLRKLLSRPFRSGRKEFEKPISDFGAGRQPMVRDERAAIRFRLVAGVRARGTPTGVRRRGAKAPRPGLCDGSAK